jgi:hypothetical protein
MRSTWMQINLCRPILSESSSANRAKLRNQRLEMAEIFGRISHAESALRRSIRKTSQNLR